jgi:hypothetical protein
MYNQFYGGGMNYQQGAYQYAQPRKPLQWTNPVTPEKAKLLQKTSPKLSLTLTELDILKASCTHRDPATRTTTLVENTDGTVTCTQCGSTFNIVETSKEEVERYVNSLVDVMQSSKLMYVDMPVDAVESYYSIIPLVEKLPQVYTIAAERFKNDVGSAAVQPGFGAANVNPWQTMNQYLGGYQQPVAPAYGQPMGYAQPVAGYQPQVYDYNVGGNPIQQGVAPQGNFASYQAPVDPRDARIRELEAQVAAQNGNVAALPGDAPEATTQKVFNV